MLRSLALCFLVVSSCPIGSPWLRAQERPNVIIILADDLGYGDVGCYPESPFRTPNLDRMAAEGIRFTDFYVPVPYCAPTRASLLTGRYPVRCGMTRNPFPREDLGGVRNADDVGIRQDELLLGEVLQQAGYRTACIGKWHLGHQPQFYPTRHGFHEYFGILYSNDMHPVRLLDGEQVVEYPVVQATLTRRYTERALRFIEENRNRPFFLYLAHAMPHKPLACSEAFFEKSGKGLYGDVMAELDWSVGQVLGALQRWGLDRKTLVFFTSDNGPWYGGSAGGLRGMKGSGCEGGIRVPLIARWPGRIPPGRVCSAPAIIMDLYVTVLAACGVPLPDDRILDGRDLTPLLSGTRESWEDTRTLFFYRGQRMIALRHGPWKLHLVAVPPGQLTAAPADRPYRDPRGPDGVRILAPCQQYHPSHHPGKQSGDPVPALSLFHVAEDPGEQHNVAAMHPDVVRELQTLAETFGQRVRAGQ